MKRILAGIDGSDVALRAVETAARLSAALGAELVIATVGRGRLSPDERYDAKRHGISEGDALEAYAQQLLLDAKKRAISSGASKVRVVECVEDDPAAALIALALREQADALVVGRRGRGRLAGLLLGSVSQKLVSLAPCSVVVVP